MQRLKSHPWIKLAYPWIIWTIAASFFFYKYLIQVSPSVMTGDLMQAFHVNGAGLGNLSAFYFYAYLVMQIPVGIMLDRYSPRLLTTAAILLCSVSTFIFSQTSVLWLACMSRAFMGVGAAFAAVSDQCMDFDKYSVPVSELVGIDTVEQITPCNLKTKILKTISS